MRRQLALGMGVILLTGCPAGFANLCDNGACDADGSAGDSGVDAPPGCNPSADPKDSPECVVDSYGVFVDATNGKDANPGTKAAPVQTIAHALSIVGSKPRVYVCEGKYGEDVVLDASHDGVSMYGGWKCADWSYSGGKPVLGKTQNSFKIDSLTKAVTIEDLEVNAIDGDATTVSSVAMFINASANVTLTRMKLSAGKGAKGSDGVTAAYTYPTAATLKGNDAPDATNGGPANTQSCPKGDSSVGGKGGNISFPGDPGQPSTLDGGAGGNGLSCSGGGTGGDGANGPAGTAATSIASIGTLASQGWLPTAGSSGTAGSVGQGGGGGAGILGGAGGGGGCGGCGGAAGGGGGGGGGSIALAVLNSSVGVVASTLAATNAGNGGNGTAGQLGQSPGGIGGNRTVGACNGGNGGLGGNGGAGAGGAGGISVGVLWKGGGAPTLDSTTKAQTTVAAQGGLKGTGGNSPANDGIPGVAQAVLQAP